MDACVAVEREVDKVLSKLGDIRENYNDELQKLIDKLETARNDLETNGLVDSEFLFSRFNVT